MKKEDLLNKSIKKSIPDWGVEELIVVDAIQIEKDYLLKVVSPCGKVATWLYFSEVYSLIEQESPHHVTDSI